MSKPKNKPSESLRVAPGEEGRLDRFLAQNFDTWSRTALQKLIDAGSVTVDGQVTPANTRVRAGQIVAVKWPVPVVRPKPAELETLPFPVLYEDDDLIVIDKPPRLVVHPAAGHYDGGTLVELLASRIEPGDWPDGIRPGLVHRLDRDTSGVIVLAKTLRTHTELSRQFARRSVKKTYLALVLGKFRSKEGTLEGNIARHPGKRQRFAISAGGRPSTTKFRVVEEFGTEFSLVELTPLTGRTHQIRVHLAGYGHPIIGDHVYGDQDKDPGVADRQMLHAQRLQFTHPTTEKHMELTAPPPADFQQTIKVLRLRA